MWVAWGRVSRSRSYPFRFSTFVVMRSRESTLEQFVQAARKLYTLPAVAVEVLTLTDDPKADHARLKTCIERDPALTARLLRVVNSSLFGLARPVADLTQAIAMLGANALRLLVLGFTLPEQLFATKASEVLRLYWRRALTRAVAARDLAAAVRNKHGDEAFIAGLLGDIGILVLVQEGEDRYLRLFRRAQDEATSLAEAERRMYGFDHTELTARILSEWKLPPTIVDAVRGGFKESFAAEQATARSPLVKILCGANMLGELLVEERTELWPELLDIAEEEWRLGADRLAEVSEALQEKVDHLAKALNLELEDSRCYRDTLDRARRKLIEASEGAAEEIVRLRREPHTEAKREPEAELLAEAEALENDVEQARRDAALLSGAHQAILNDASRPTGSRGAKKATGAPSAVAPAAATTKKNELDTTLRRAVIECRQAREPLSLVLVELDRFDESVAEFGLLWGQYASKALADVCATTEWPRARVVAEQDGRRALILPDADRVEASRITAELLRRYRLLCPHEEAGSTTLSTGTATVSMPARNFPADALVAAARRCLYAAQLAAGDNSKSIEIS